MRPIFALILPIICFVFFTTQMYGQTAPLDKYHFKDGGYIFMGTFSHHSDHPLQKKLGEFYTDEIQVLNELKKSWRFSRPQKDYACGFHYNFLILRNSVVQDSFVVNLECNQLRTSDRSLYFDLKKLNSFSSKFKKLHREFKEFKSISEARVYLETLNTNPNFVYFEKPRWKEFEGEFRFNTKCPTPDKSCNTDFKKIKPILENEISARYAGEKFRLEESGGSSNGDLFVTVKCNKSLEEQFTLYDRWNKQAFGKWEPYYLGLYSYFTVAR